MKCTTVNTTIPKNLVPGVAVAPDADHPTRTRSLTLTQRYWVICACMLWIVKLLGWFGQRGMLWLGGAYFKARTPGCEFNFFGQSPVTHANHEDTSISARSMRFAIIDDLHNGRCSGRSTPNSQPEVRGPLSSVLYTRTTEAFTVFCEVSTGF